MSRLRCVGGGSDAPPIGFDSADAFRAVQYADQLGFSHAGEPGADHSAAYVQTYYLRALAVGVAALAAAAEDQDR